MKWGVSVDNALKVATDTGLARFQLPEREADRPSAFHWPRLTVASDMGSDGLCCLSWLRSQQVNIFEAPDVNHGNWNDIRLALQQTGLWPFFLMQITAFNSFHGPWDESRFWHEVREAVSEYCSVSATAEGCPIFNYYLEAILRDMGCPERYKEKGIAEEIFGDLADSACFRRKGAKCSLNRFMGGLYKFRYEEKADWHKKLIGCLYWGITSGKFKKSKFAQTFKAPLVANADVEDDGDQPVQAGEVTLKQLWQVCENSLHVATVIYGDEENLMKSRLIDFVCSSAMGWHSEQNKTLRSCESNLSWLQGQCHDAFVPSVRDAFGVFFDPKAMDDMILNPAYVKENIGGLDVNHPLFAMHNDHAELAVRLAFNLAGCRLRRCMWFLRGWPARGCLFGTKVPLHVAEATRDRLKADWENFKALKAVKPGNPCVKHSVFTEASSLQLVRIMEEETWQLTDRVRAWADKAYSGIVSTQITEDAFNRQRRGEKKGSNRLVSRIRRHSVLVQRKVIQSVHKYKPVKYHNVVPPKNRKLPDEAFHSNAKDATLNMLAIPGHASSASWYSPSAQNFPQRYVELEMVDQLCGENKQWHRLDSTWWSYLLDGPTILVRKTGSAQWYFSLGMFASGDGALGWPAKCVDEEIRRIVPDAGPGRFFVPDLECDGNHMHWLFMTADDGFEGMVFSVRSPLWHLRSKGDGDSFKDIPPRLLVQASDGDGAQPLLRLAALQAFYKIPKHILVKICEIKGLGVSAESSLFDVLFRLVQHCTGLEDNHTLEILLKRMKVKDDDLTSLFGMDGLEDIVAKEDKAELKKVKGKIEKDDEVRKSFLREWKQKHEKVKAPGGAGAGKGAGRGKGKGGILPPMPGLPKDVKFVESELTRDYVQARLPPAAYVWRSKGGSWQVHLAPHSRISRSWNKWGEVGACREVLQGVWRQYLGAKGLPDDACPIKGIFS
ncbi:unnamed protein product [Prorocentrum cordatum]|uniref:RNA-directed RNA polymerase n=1 Tax=Prorocentrum cordatum TaxID=2364126 RepID=A0ABN9WQX9_9DINO|nr:unnamed protein product [Polarella glacialis]